MIATSESQFDAAYWASKSPEIIAMVSKIRASTDPNSKLLIAESVADVLYSQGRFSQADLVDNAIMVMGWGPFSVMSIRASDGMTSVLDGLGQHAIAVSLDLDNYPAYSPAVPPAPVQYQIVQPVAGFPGWFEMSPDGPAYPVGTKRVVNFLSYVKGQFSQGPMGPLTAWQLQSAS